MVYLFPNVQSPFLVLYFQNTLRIQPYGLVVVGEHTEGSWIIDITSALNSISLIAKILLYVANRGTARFVCRSNINQPRFRNQAAREENGGNPIIRSHIAVSRTSTWHRQLDGGLLLGTNCFLSVFVFPSERGLEDKHNSRLCEEFCKYYIVYIMCDCCHQI